MTIDVYKNFLLARPFFAGGEQAGRGARGLFDALSPFISMP